jgi:hypothetical protein
MTRHVLAVIVVCLCATTLHAQLEFPAYLPSQCQPAAEGVIAGATDGKVMAVIGIGATVPVGPTEIKIAVNLETGRSPLWVYIVYSAALDTVTTVPIVRVLGQCNDDLFPDPGTADQLEGIRFAPLPNGYLEGTALTARLKSDATFNAFRQQHPDSNATIVILATSDEQVLSYPAGTPFWLFTWVPADQSLGLTCVVHALTGETLCFGDDPTSVATEASERGFGIAPNPASADAIVRVPQEWIGRRITIDAVNSTGQIVPLVSEKQIFAPVVPINAGLLANGMWSLRVGDGHTFQTIPLSIVR